MKSIILIICFCPFMLVAQIFDTISFNNYTPDWIHYSNLETLDSISNYIPFVPLIHGSDLFLTHNLNDTFFEGHVTEKINLISGQLDWQSYYFSDEILKREYGQKPYVDSTGNLTMLAFREREKTLFDTWTYKGYVDAKFVRRQMDYHDGHILDEFIDHDGKIFSLTIPGDLPYTGPYFENALYPKKDSILFFHFRGNRSGSDFWTGTFDPFLNTPVVWNVAGERKSGYQIENLSMFDLEDETILTIRQWNVRFSSEFYVLLTLLDRDLNTIYEHEITDLVDHARRYNIEDAGTNYSLIHASSDSTMKNIYYHLNTDGGLMERINFDTTSNLVDYHAGSAIKLKNRKHLLFVNSSVNLDGDQSLYFLRSDGNGHIDTINQLVFANQQDRFECRKLVELENGNLLINLAHNMVLMDQKEITKSVWMMVSGEALGIYTSIPNIDGNNIGISNSKFEIFPNPSKNVIHLKCLEACNPVLIEFYNNLGQLVKSLNFTSRIDVSDLVQGNYFIEIFDQKGDRLGLQQLVILK